LFKNIKVNLFQKNKLIQITEIQLSKNSLLIKFSSDVKKAIRNNQNKEMSNRNISLFASILSLMVIFGICLLGFEIYKNHQKARIVTIDHADIEKKYDYVLLDNEETQSSSREIKIEEI
jgi:hypothetical protein